MTDIISDLIEIITGSTNLITTLIQSNGYLALVILMTLEGASLPIPSEIVIPAAGYFAAKGMLNLYIVFAAVLLGNTFGMAIDYAIGYYIGKDVVYKHLNFFHVSQKRLDSFS